MTKIKRAFGRVLRLPAKLLRILDRKIHRGFTKVFRGLYKIKFLRPLTKKTYRFIHHHHRITASVLLVLIVAGVAIPVAQPYLRAQRYTLNKQAQGLLGETDKDLTKKLTFDDKNQLFQFNKDAKKTPTKEGNPLEKLKSQVGGGGSEDSQLYSVDVSKDLSKGVTYYDNQMELSFKLTPQFSTMQGEEKEGHLIYPLNGVKGQLAYTVGAAGLKENIVLYKSPGNEFKMSYKLELPKSLEARLIEETGEIGIYSADPALFGNITYGTSDDQAKVEAARNNSEKTYLTFKIPAPVVMGLGKTNQAAIAPVKSQFELSGDTLSVITTGLEKAEYPLSIDPSVTVDSTSDFQTGNMEDNNLSVNSGDLNRGTLTGGSFGSFSPEDSFTGGRYWHASVVYNGYLYVLGGFLGNGSSDNTIQKSSIDSSGTIGPWSSGGSNFNLGRYGIGAVVYNGYMYVLGGASTAGIQDDIQYAPINPSTGDVGSWITSANHFSTPRYNLSAAVYNGYIYMVAGQKGTDNAACVSSGTSSFCNDVQYAPIKANGDVGAWQSANSFATPTRGWHNAVVYNGYMYVLGGEGDGSTIYSDVQYAPIKATGELGSWAVTTSLPTGRSAHVAIAYNGYMYLVGGYRSDTATTADTVYAPINANGSLGSWTTTTSFNTPRYSHTAVIYNNNVYVLGGTGSLNTVQYAPIDPPGVTTRYSTASNNFTTARQSHTSVAYNGYMYVIGGTNGTLQSDVQYAPISSDGNIGAWTSTNSLAIARERSAATVYNGYLYVTGGRKSVSDTTCRASGTGSGSWCDDVQYALICTGTNSGSGGCTSTPGTVGTWNTSSNRFTTARWAHSAVAYNGYLYIIAGSGGGVLSDIRFAPINSNGNIGTWSGTVSNITTARYLQSAVVYGGYLYVIGGDDNSGGANFLSDVQYAPINSNGTLGSWQFATSLPSPGRATHTTVASNGYIYVIGGSTPTARISDVVYAPINNDGSLGSWAPATNLPAVRDSHTSVIYNGFLYVIGGNGGSGFLSDIRYTQINNGGSGTLGSWSNATNLPSTALYHATVVYNGFMYNIESTVVRYVAINEDGSLGTWNTTASAASNGRSTAVAYNGYMYLLGGNNGTPAINTVQKALIKSDGSLDAWGTTTPLTSARSELGAVAYNGYMYVLGGHDSTTYYDIAEYAPIDPTTGALGSWIPTTSLTTNRYKQSTFVYNNYIYVIGGSTGSANLNVVEYAAINPTTGALGSWIPTTSFSVPRYLHSAGVSNGYIYILGGNTNYLTDVQYAPINANGTVGNWSNTTPLTQGRYGHSSVVYNGYIYILGGTSSGGTLNLVQYAPINAMPRKAQYSKLIDLGTPSRVTSIDYTGTLPRGLYNVKYRMAGTDGVFGATQSASGALSCSNAAGRYIHVLATLDDSSVGTFRDVLNTNNAKLSSISVTTTPLGTPPEKRLRHGAWFSESVLQPFETNPNGCS